jgi:hypothetical protein
VASLLPPGSLTRPLRMGGCPSWRGWVGQSCLGHRCVGHGDTSTCRFPRRNCGNRCFRQLQSRKYRPGARNGGGWRSGCLVLYRSNTQPTGEPIGFCRRRIWERASKRVLQRNQRNNYRNRRPGDSWAWEGHTQGRIALANGRCGRRPKLGSEARVRGRNWRNKGLSFFQLPASSSRSSN